MLLKNIKINFNNIFFSLPDALEIKTYKDVLLITMLYTPQSPINTFYRGVK